MAMTEFPSEVQRELQNYVYALVNPRSDQIFYVGKGCGNRAFEHLSEDGNSEKHERIEDIRSDGLEPRVDVLAHGLSKENALKVEAVCIDVIGLGQLTNRVTGQNSSWGGRQSAEKIVATIGAEPVEVDDPALVINIAQTFYYGMSERDLYDITRGIWRLNVDRARNIDLVLAVHEGVIQEAYQPDDWHPAGTTDYERRDLDPEHCEGRWEFTGQTAPESLRKTYVGKRPSNISFGQNPIRYINGA